MTEPAVELHMIFNSCTFVVFFFVVAGAYYLLPLTWRAKKVLLLVTSYVFYGAWNPPFVLLLIFSAVLDFWLGRALGHVVQPLPRRALLVVSLVANLGLLSYFKYGGFLLENFQAALASVGVAYEPPKWDIVLPLGISFYTFETISYTIDVYRNKLEPCRSFVDFALFLTFFPHLVAGPIVRPADFLPQLEQEKRASLPEWTMGLSLLVIGLFQKTVLADGILAPLVDSAYLPDGTHGMRDAWLGTLAFSAQIFYDFAGYTLCALGIARCFGMRLTENFRCPYGAVGFSDFWRRWHISLSTWLRDYLYIPLGGNQQGSARTHVNLMATMLIGGLWHGASWTFVAWGAVHGTYLFVERVVRGPKVGGSASPQGINLALQVAVTYMFICFSWVFFRAPDFATAGAMLHAMVGLPITLPGAIPNAARVLTAMFVVAAMLASHVAMRNTSLEQVLARLKAPWHGAMLGLMLFAIATASGGQRAFIYFQF